MSETLALKPGKSLRHMHSAVVCATCGEENNGRSRFCQLCGVAVDAGPATDVHEQLRRIGELAPGGAIRSYRLLRLLPTYGDVHGFLGVNLSEDGRRSPVIVRIRQSTTPQPSKSGVELLRPPPNSAADTVRMAVGGYTSVDPLHQQYDILSHARHPALPAPLDYFEEHGQAVLVESAALGTPLLSVWNMLGVTPALRMAWLDEIRSALLELHRRNVIFPLLSPNRVVISPDGRARIRDAMGLCKLPLAHTAAEWTSPAVAPELVRTPLEASLQADVYHFGAFVWATFLGRDLQPSDFLEVGVPKPFIDNFPDAVPPLVRLVRKSVCVDLQTRFPTNAGRATDASGFNDIRDALAEYTRASDGLRYDVAGWSNTGILRDNNEDCFTISSLCAGAADNRRDMVLVCVADGMGGLEKGEVAAAAAVTAVAEYLRANGLTSAAMDQFGDRHPLGDVPGAASVLEKAMHEANRQVYELSRANGGQSNMGCTLEAVLCVGRNAIVYHVGDSRVYHKTGSTIRQLTVDQTFVNKLLERGEITAEEAEIHPYRAAVVQAIGAQATLEPAFYQAQIQAGDWLLICSDGVSNHINLQELNLIFAHCVNAEQASRRIVNLAITRGGFDNATAVVVAAR